MVVINTGTSIFQLNASKPRRPLDTADLEEPTDSCERTGAPVLRLSCEGEIDVFELCSDNFYLSAILDRQGLMEAAPVDLRTKKAEGSSPQAPQDFWSRIKMKNPKIVVMSSTAFSEYTNRNEVTTVPSVLDHRKLKKNLWALLQGRQPKWIFLNFGDLSQPF